MKPRSILGWLLVLTLGLFVMFNLDPVEVWLFGFRVSMPIGLVVLMSALLGAGALYLLIVFKRRSNR